MDPLLIDGIAAFVVFELIAGQFIGTRHLLAEQHPPRDTWLAGRAHLRADPHPSPVPGRLGRRLPDWWWCTPPETTLRTPARHLRAHLDIAPAQPGSGGRRDPVRLGRRDGVAVDPQPDRVAILATYVESEPASWSPG
jgi:hypothetical protein